MLLIRCTGKLRKDMGLKEAGLYRGPDPESPLDTWYANLMRVSRRKCVLFTHAASLFSFFTFDAGKASLRDPGAVFRAGLKEAMKNEGFPETIISRLDDRYREVRLAPTASRSVLGSMNDLAIQIRFSIERRGGLEHCDLAAFGCSLNQVPMGALGFRYPIELFAELLGTSRQALLDARLAAAAGSGSVYQLKATLMGSEPPIWRRLLVRDLTLDRLSDFLIAAMGWRDEHLHIYTIGGRYYSVPDPNWGAPEVRDESAFRLSDVISPGQQSFIYEYDLGDSWRHEVTVESISAPEDGQRYPVCLAGARACPPEDVGGIAGFHEFLEVVSDPAHPEHKRLLTWAGGYFNPTSFDLKQANRALIASALEPPWLEIR